MYLVYRFGMLVTTSKSKQRKCKKGRRSNKCFCITIVFYVLVVQIIILFKTIRYSPQMKVLINMLINKVVCIMFPPIDNVHFMATFDFIVSKHSCLYIDESFAILGNVSFFNFNY